MRVSLRLLSRKRFSAPSLCLFLVLSGAAIFAQAPAAAPAQKPAASDVSGESLIIEREDLVYSYNADGTGFRQSTLAITVQSDAALRSLSVVNVPFASNSEKVEFQYVRVRRHDGTVVETPLTQAMEQPAEVTREAPFYSDIKQEQLPVKSLGVGDTLEWQARIIRTRAEAPGEFWGEESFTEPGDVLAREESIELRLPKTKQVTVWTNPRYLDFDGVKPASDTSTGDQRIVRWEFASLRPTTGPVAEAAKETRKKHVLTAGEERDAEEGKLPSVAWTTFPNWAAVGAWYRGLQGDRTTPTQEIRNRVAELTAGKSTEEDKVRAIYAFVSAQIRYIGVAFGVGRYQPHRAEDVLSNQYGDCKDKETLLASMLAVLGLHTDAVLIGSGIRFNSAVPSPGAFNHLIAQVEMPGGPIWLDPTAEVAPYRMIIATLRDREALVIPDSAPATVQHIPVDLPFAPTQDWTAVGKLNSAGTSESHIVVTFRGDDELIFRAVARQVPPSNWDELGQKIIANMGYVGTASHVEFSRPEDTTEPFRFAFDYKREHSGDWDNHRILAQLAPVTLPTVDDKEPPTASLNLLAPRVERSSSTLTLPEGWRAELPEAIHTKSRWATYDVTYHFDKDTIRAERTVTVLQRKVPAADWKEWKKFQDSAELGLENYIQLTHATVPTKGAVPPPAPELVTPVPSTPSGRPNVIQLPHGDSVRIEKSPSTHKTPPPTSTEPTTAEPPATSTSEAERFIQQAAQAGSHFDLATATGLLNRARAFNAEVPRLWLIYGMVAMEMGKPIEADTDFHKELSLHPDFLPTYGAIAQAELMQRHRPEAEAALRSWVIADASAVQPALQLGNLLLEDNKAADAVSVATAAAANFANPAVDDPAVQLLLGKAQLKAGQRDAGDKTLTALLNVTGDSGMLNDAAYELSDAGLELALARQSEEKALAKLTEETRAWTLDESPATLKARTALLVASWDTMGWILFRQGELREAQGFIAAAWLNSQHTVVREHLVKVQTALGPAFARSPDAIDLAKSEQAQRTIALGKADGRNGVGEYRLLLSAGNVERVEPDAGGKTLPNGEAIIRSAKLPHFFPPASDARLVRQAMLNCHSDICELVLAP